MKIHQNQTLASLPVLLALCLVLGPPPAALAGSPVIQVTTTDDELNHDGDCSLREAVEAANTDAAVDACPAGSGADVIKLQPFATYTLGLAGAGEDGNQTGDLDILDDVTLDAKRSTIDAAGVDRALDVHPGLTVVVNRATITGGDVAGLPDPVGLTDTGGGIRNRGSAVIVNESTIAGNLAVDGGGIGNIDGVMTLNDCTVSENTVVNVFGDNSSGGGIQSVTSSGDTDLTLNRCVVSGNLALGDPPTASQGFGGGISSLAGSAHTATLELNDTEVTDNHATGDATFRAGGGGIMSFSVHPVGMVIATLTDSTVSGNSGPAAGGIMSGTFVPLPARAELYLNRSTVSGNTAYAVRDTSGTPVLATGVSGGIHNFNSNLVCANSTISGNTAIGNPTYTQGYAGGLWNVSYGQPEGQPSTAILINTTVTGNRAAAGGGIANMAFTGDYTAVTFKNSIVAGNSAYAYGDCLNAYLFLPDGFNLDSDTTCGFAMTADPLLGPLQDNGGPTETHALLPGSPALDAGNDDTCAAPPIDGVDQRGKHRPAGPACDLGAYELHDDE